MKFTIYDADIAPNCSLNILCYRHFEAENVEKAIEMIKYKKKHPYLEKWQYQKPHMYIQGFKTGKCGFKPNCFVCKGEFCQDNIIWKQPKSIINFFDIKKKQ